MKALLGKLALVVLGSFLALLILELSVLLLPPRLLPAPLRDLASEINIRSHKHNVPDPQLRYVIRPGTDFVFTWRDFSFRLKTNLNFPHAGFRGGTLGGPAWGVAVGDSFTFGHGVNQEATWIAQLAKSAQREIINLGVAGWGPQQYTRVLEEYGLPMQPKVVFYGLYSNDLSDSVIFEKWRQGRVGGFSLGRFLREHSVTFSIFRNLRLYLEAGSGDIRLNDVGYRFSSKRLKKIIETNRKSFRPGWPIVKREIEKALEDCQRANATFVLLYFPSKEEVYWDLIKENAESLGSLDNDVGILRKSTLEFCRSRQLLCLDLTPPLKKRAADRQKLYYSIDEHWNDLGHRIVAGEIHRFLLDRKIL
jgi:GDSL-like lipase/acylhydrolase family protein